jgi:hypothetical protein
MIVFDVEKALFMRDETEGWIPYGDRAVNSKPVA